MNTEYTKHSILRIAKRYKNSKRSYLLVNPLQAKHIPIKPSDALAMMGTLGNKLKEKYPTTKLIIGFAETATAIGAAIADNYGADCKYIHTTRENYPSEEKVEFKEEHSHAVEQQLLVANLKQYIDETDTIILVDDELSTGKTLLNIIEVLKEKFSSLETKNIVVASLLNRLSDENLKRLYDANVACEYLLKLPEEDYDSQVEKVCVDAPEDICCCGDIPDNYNIIETEAEILNPRRAISISEYVNSCRLAISKIVTQLSFSKTENVLVLGTEEFMYPAILLGQTLEEIVNTVKCHSTTRSPIGVNGNKSYPIYCGYKLNSFYDDLRDTYIYDIESYDKVLVITDAKSDCTKAINCLTNILQKKGNKEIYFIKGAK